jgi:hypothetical protein
MMTTRARQGTDIQAWSADRKRERAALLHAHGGFPGWDELKTQAAGAEDCRECHCGCGTVNRERKEPRTRAASREPVPVEAYREFLDVLLFVREGFLSSLEIMDDLDVRPVTYSSPKELKLRV